MKNNKKLYQCWVLKDLDARIKGQKVLYVLTAHEELLEQELLGLVSHTLVAKADEKDDSYPLIISL